jgi:hypothetical protein
VLSRTKPVVVDVWRRLQGGVTLLLMYGGVCRSYVFYLSSNLLCAKELSVVAKSLFIFQISLWI